MEVEDIYQDNEGKWHIDYSSSHLIGLAIRVYAGQLALGLICLIPLMLFVGLAGLALGKSLPEKENISSSFRVKQESVCPKIFK